MSFVNEKKYTQPSGFLYTPGMFPGNENCQKRKKAQAELYPPPGRPPQAGSKIESGGVVGHQQWVVCEEQKGEL